MTIERVVTMRGGVKIAKRYEGPQLQRHRSASRHVNPILDRGGVLAMNHEHALLDFDSFDFVNKRRKRTELEFLEQQVPLGMDRTWVLIHREVVTAAARDQCFLDLRKQNQPAHRRLS